jgi:hypothetical protein
MNSYLKRIEKEITLKTNKIREGKIFSENSKTLYSINLPCITCNPSEICKEVCYATKGPIIYKRSIIKALEIHNLIENKDYAQIVDKILKECKSSKIPFIRWCGSGDITKKTTQIINKVPYLQVVFSRKPELLNIIKPDIIKVLSIDESSLNRMKNINKGTKIAYLFTKENTVDILRKISERINIIFLTSEKLINKIPEYLKNKLCPCDAGIRDRKLSCLSCYNTSKHCFERD